jgi:hypothetical protein
MSDALCVVPSVLAVELASGSASAAHQINRTVKFENKVSIRKGFINRRVGCLGPEIGEIQEKFLPSIPKEIPAPNFRRTVFRSSMSSSGGSEEAVRH